MISTDKYINYYIEKIIYLFKYIHPNYITIIGLFINFINIYFYYNIFIFFILFNFLRILCDNLDGMIARKYNKCSLIGGYLDTLSDIIHILIISYLILNDIFHIFYTILLLLLFLFLIILYMYKVNALSDHNNLYNRYEYKLIDYIPIFFALNTYLSMLFLNIFFILKLILFKS